MGGLLELRRTRRAVAFHPHEDPTLADAPGQRRRGVPAEHPHPAEVPGRATRARTQGWAHHRPQQPRLPVHRRRTERPGARARQKRGEIGAKRRVHRRGHRRRVRVLEQTTGAPHSDTLRVRLQPHRVRAVLLPDTDAGYERGAGAGRVCGCQGAGGEARAIPRGASTTVPAARVFARHHGRAGRGR